MDLHQAEVSNDRKQLVVKSNTLIQKTRYQLTLQEQKILLYVISKVKPTDNEFQYYSFEIRDFCDACGISYSGKNFSDLKDAILELYNKGFWFRENGEVITCSWIGKAKIKDGSSTVQIRLDETLKPYLLHIYENYTSYEVSCALVMKSKYSIRMYELLKSYCYVETVSMSIEELREMLQCYEYADYRNFRRNVIEKAIDEINQFTDIRITYETYREGRSIKGFIFTIRRKSSAEEVAVRVRREAALDAK